MGKAGNGKIAQKATEAGMTEPEYLEQVLVQEKSVAGAARVIDVYTRAVIERMRYYRMKLDIEVKVVHY